MEHFKAILLTFLFSTCVLGSTGEVTFFVFEDEKTAQNVTIEIVNKSVFKTNSQGIAEITLEEGSYHARIYQNESDFQNVNFKVAAGESTIINLTLLGKSKRQEVLSTSSLEIQGHQAKGPENAIFIGDVSSFNKKKPIKGVRVIVHGVNKESVTDKFGKFKLKLAAGIYDISFMHDKFSTTTLNKIKIDEKQKIQENIILRPSGMELEEFVVLSPNLKSSVSALLEVRRGHQTVADLIGSEQISKAGDSDAGSSLKRVTGLSLVDGKYVYVRGLGERYSSTLLNSAMIPSPDPSRRVVPLDLFPANVIENMVVQKGYSPEMPGEFGGGSIQIKTKTLPAKKYTKFSFSNNFSSTDKAKTYEGDSQDWIGYAGNSRSMPSQLKNYSKRGVNISSLSSEERKKLAQSVNKSYETRSLQGSDNASIPNFTLSTGNKLRVGKVRMGYNISSLYSNNWIFNEEKRTQYNQSGSQLTKDSSKMVGSTNNVIKLGAMVGLGLEYKDQKLTYNGSLLRNTINYVNEDEGINSEKEEFLRTKMGWNERSVETHQISGESSFRKLNKSMLSWNYTYSKAQLDMPDNKMYTYLKEGSQYQLETENGSSSNSVSWNSMPDVMRNFSANYEQPFSLGAIRAGKIIVGMNTMEREREYLSRTFYFKFDESKSLDPSGSPRNVFSDPSAELYQQANDTDNYNANQKINAQFVNLILPVSSFTLTSGVRYETSLQEVESFKLFNGGTTVSSLETKDYLPVVSLTYKLTPKMQIRANYSETVSRPDLREISNTVWNDIDLGAKFKGNPMLKAAQIENWGVRWEWFYGRGEILSLGYFRKNFTRPIEEIFGSLSDDGRVVGTTETQYTFLNIDKATSQGLEFEFRKKLTEDLTLGGNYSWIKSDVTIAPERAGQLTTLDRPLQGQSPYLANIQIDYEPKKWDATFTLLYNDIGRRITGVGADGRPDEYQESVASLDFVSSKKIYKNWNLKFKAKNLLDPEIKRTQGDKVTRVGQRGRQYTIGLNAVF